MTALISAHRGGTPVDGVSATERYRRAIELGVDFVEFDVRRTRDGATVVFHDERTASGRVISGLTYHELAEELGQEAMTLDDLLDVAAGRVGLHLDLKETGYEAEIVQAALDRSPPRAWSSPRVTRRSARSKSSSRTCGRACRSARRSTG